MLLKKMIPAAHDGSTGSQSRPPTNTSDPRGSRITAVRMSSALSRSRSSRSRSDPCPSCGPPSIMMRVGSPPVCESMTFNCRRSALMIFQNGLLKFESPVRLVVKSTRCRCRRIHWRSDEPRCRNRLHQNLARLLSGTDFFSAGNCNSLQIIRKQHEQESKYGHPVPGSENRRPACAATGISRCFRCEESTTCGPIR